MTPAELNAWFDQWGPTAQKCMEKFGQPASVTLAQAKIESSDKNGNGGQSKCALDAKNYFGIKAFGTKPYIEFPTKEFKNGHPYMEQGAKFEKFATVEDSFLRHGELIANEPRYRSAMEVCHDHFDNPFDRAAAFAARLQACGYSTNPIYSQEITSVIRSHNLTKWDVPPEPPASGNAPLSAAGAGEVVAA